MKIALLNGGIVVNVILAPDDLTPKTYGDFLIPILDTGYEAAQALQDDESCSLGDRLVDGRFVTPEPTREERAVVIDAATSSRIAGGFMFALRKTSARISLSLASQASVALAFAARDALTYPLKWPTFDDGVLELASAKDVEALHVAATRAVLAARTDGVSAKEEADRHAAKAAEAARGSV